MLTKIFRYFKVFLRPFYDTRTLTLLSLSAWFSYVVDPTATLGLAGYMTYVIGMWGAALLVTKILMPYLKTSELARSALENGNMAAALVLAARTFLIVAIAISFMCWGK